jgi:phosphoribosylformimino-5-aminoimidazole carboxamide ribotide isomerase
VIAAPAVDLREGRCVQLVGGRPEEERVSLPDPIAVAIQWWEMGFRTLHIVDLDAALGLGSNRDTIRKLVEATGASVQAGGGIRSSEDVDDLITAGAQRLIVGTRAINDPAWLERVSESHRDRILVAADIRDGQVLRKGWTEGTGLHIEEFLRLLASLPLAGVLCTDVSREGRMAGIDRHQMESIIEASPHPVWASGGISTMDELRALDEAGAMGAVLGMALYKGVLPTEDVAREFGE